MSEWGDENAPLLVLLHGWGDTGSSFQFMVDELQRDFHVVAPDWRGFGRSGHVNGSYWFPDYVADLHEILQTYSPDNAVQLLGHSMGGNIAGLYAGTFPERVAAFINVEGFGLPDSDPHKAPANYRRWIEKGRIMEGYSAYGSFEELAEKLVSRNSGLSFARAMFIAQEWAVMSDDGSVRLRADPAHKLPNAVQYRRAEAEACWRAITARILIVMGEESRFLASARAWLDGDSLARPYALAPRAAIPGAGHMVHIEQPARLATTVETFLKTL